MGRKRKLHELLVMRLRVFHFRIFPGFFFLQMNIYEKKVKTRKKKQFTWLITPGIISQGNVPKMKTEVVMMKEIKCIR